jgi:hypothetical protein
MKFELDKCYKHENGSKMKVIAVVKTDFYGTGLLAETNDMKYRRIGNDEDNTVGWTEISNEEWMECVENPYIVGYDYLHLLNK